MSTPFEKLASLGENAARWQVNAALAPSVG